MYIYKITNLINQKIYIGKSRRKRRNVRWIEHLSMALNPKKKNRMVIDRAIKKYGQENFYFEIIYQCQNDHELSEKESQMIAFYGSKAPIGYNVVTSKQEYCEMSPDHRFKLRKSKQGLSSKRAHYGYLGVGKSDGRFTVDLYLADRVRRKRSYCNPVKAAIAYDKMNLFMFGPTAKINFEKKRDKYLKSNLKKFYDNFIADNQRTSKFNKVYFLKQHNRWIAFHPIVKNGKPNHISKYCKTELEAAEIADMLCLYFNGNLDFLNFPEKMTYYKSLDLHKELFIRIKKPKVEKPKKLKKPLQNIYFRKDRQQYTIIFRFNGKNYRRTLFKTKESAEIALKELKAELGIST